MQSIALYNVVRTILQFPMSEVPASLTLTCHENVAREAAERLQADELPVSVRLSYNRKFGTLFVSFDDMQLAIVTFDAH